MHCINALFKGSKKQTELLNTRMGFTWALVVILCLSDTVLTYQDGK